MLLLGVCFPLFPAKLLLALSSDVLSGFFWWNSKKGNPGDRDLQPFQSFEVFLHESHPVCEGTEAF